MRVSIIIPILREDSAARCADAVYKNAGIPTADFELITGYDHKRIGCPKMTARLRLKCKADLICFLGDDTIPEPDFLKNALRAMAKLPDGWGVVGMHTEPGNDHAHWLAHTKMLDLIPGGEFFPIDYEHCFGDDELKDIAVENGRFIFAEDAKIQHIHPINKSAEYDEYYEAAYGNGKFERDQSIYRRRKIERMRAKYGVKLGLCYPLVDIWNYTHFTFSNLNVVLNYMADTFNEGGKPNIDIIMPNYPGSIEAIRNNLVTQALNLGCTHVLMMDTDQIYEDADMIQRLLDRNLDVVGTMVHRRYPPYDPLVMRGEFGKLTAIPDEEIRANSLLKVTATGCGCILYSTNVFQAIGYPWFVVEVAPDGHTVGEDIGFCKKMGEAGFDIHVDTTIGIQHLSTVGIDWSVYKVYKHATLTKEKKP